MDCSASTTDDDSSENNDVVTAKDRQLICDWCYSIVDATQFDRETVAMVSYIYIIHHTYIIALSRSRVILDFIAAAMSSNSLSLFSLLSYTRQWK